VLKTTIYEDMQTSIQYNEVSGDGLHTFRIHLTKNVTNSSWMGTYLYLELLSLPDSTPQASLSIGAITVVLPEPTISLTSATSDADEVEAQVSATPYNIAMSLCPDEQSYVMLEAIDEYGGTMLFTDSIVENYNTLPMTPTTYSFETNYSGSATTACLRTFIRVRNVVDGSFEDLVPSDTVCGIELGTALSVTDHFIQTKTPGTYQLFDMGGKLVEMGRCTLGEKELGNQIYPNRRAPKKHSLHCRSKTRPRGRCLWQHHTDHASIGHSSLNHRTSWPSHDPDPQCSGTCHPSQRSRRPELAV
jgi:hypothetical protein